MILSKVISRGGFDFSWVTTNICSIMVLISRSTWHVALWSNTGLNITFMFWPWLKLRKFFKMEPKPWSVLIDLGIPCYTENWITRNLILVQNRKTTHHWFVQSSDWNKYECLQFDHLLKKITRPIPSKLQHLFLLQHTVLKNKLNKKREHSAVFLSIHYQLFKNGIAKNLVCLQYIQDINLLHLKSWIGLKETLGLSINFFVPCLICFFQQTDSQLKRRLVMFRSSESSILRALISPKNLLSRFMHATA